MLDEIKISKAIIETFTDKLIDSLELDVAIVGGGPAGIVCGYYLAKKNIKVALFERKISLGGGMWGGGIMFNEIVVQSQAKKILEEFDIKTKLYKENYYTADSIEAVSTLCSKATKAGLKVFNLVSVEDVMIRKNNITGIVINWSAVELARLHVDPICVRSKFVVDATGHAAEVSNIVARKIGNKLNTKSGRVEGERPMWAQVAEEAIIKNSREVFPNLYTCGMCANAVFGAARMGPVFGGMLLSGKKIASTLMKKIK
ncbi:MAG: sulfide-dependent adenosine diphosphate thiazole synthase [Candidatus Gygaella obscura]|nr:sulfide-dependent adenosine diphosphate thiazole synthase [Candidatus Gygaella obscura]